MAYKNEDLELFETELLEAWRDLVQMPDRERAFLAMGERSCWPQVLRDPVTDYPGDDTPRRLGLSRAQMARLDLLLIGEHCVAAIVPADRVKLMGVVLALKASPRRRDFKWQTVFQHMGGRRCGVTKDTLEARYRTQLARMADHYQHRLVALQAA